MRYSLLILLLLTGCTNPAAELETVLNDYAVASANQADLTPYLVDQALQSELETRKLLDDLGLISFGASSFSETTQIETAKFLSCLDVSRTSFQTFSGEPVLLDRISRQIVEIGTTGSKVSNLSVTGLAC